MGEAAGLSRRTSGTLGTSREHCADNSRLPGVLIFEMAPSEGFGGKIAVAANAGLIFAENQGILTQRCSVLLQWNRAGCLVARSPAITMPCAKAPMKTTTRHTLVACSAALLLASFATLHAAETNSTTTAAQIANGLAPEVTDLSPKSVSWAQEAKLPDLDKAFISTAPADRKDGIPVGQLENKEAILAFATEIAAGKHGEIDSLLLSHHGKLLFESYYRRGRINYPHYQMSITKSYTAMAIGRAIQLGYLTMADLDKPVVAFFKTLEPGKLVPGAASITLAQAMNMRSGIRLEDGKAKELLKQPGKLKGQGQVRAYLEHCAPIPPAPRKFKYQEADPAIAMQVLEAVAPGGARAFIKKELFGKMGITNFAWENDVSGLPKAAAGCGLPSRDMLKWGMLVVAKGKWQGEQLIPAPFVERATSPITLSYGTSYYGFFWWLDDFKVDGTTYHCIEGRGAGGQFIFMFPELELIAVVTAHTKGMGNMLGTLPSRVVPAFVVK